MSEHKEPIPSMIYNAAVGGHVTNSQQIIDENENKEQSQINAEVKQILGQGGSIDTRIANAVNTEKTRAEEAEEQLRQAYEALSQSQPIPVTELPATGEAGKIYRLAGTTSYADYMYSESDLTTPIKMAEYDNAIDDEPIVGSKNLIESGGVRKIVPFTTNSYNLFNYLSESIVYGKYIDANDGVEYNLNSYCYFFIDVVVGADYSIPSEWNVHVAFFDNNNTYISGSLNTQFTAPSGAIKMSISIPKDRVTDFIVVKGDVMPSYKQGIVFDRTAIKEHSITEKELDGIGGIVEKIDEANLYNLPIPILKVNSDSPNLLIYQKWIDGYYYAPNGEVQPVAEWSVMPLMHCKPSTRYGKYECTVAIFDNNLEFIGYYTPPVTSFETTANAAFFGVCSANKSLAKLQEGELRGIGSYSAIPVFDKHSIDGLAPVIVDMNGNGDYTTILEALINSEEGQTIEVLGGVYNIKNEYMTIYGNSYFDNYQGYATQNPQDAGYYLKKGIKLIGKGSVELVFDYSSSNQNVHEYFSPINTTSDNVVENITITVSENCRYHIHDDFAGDSIYYQGVNVFRNLIFNGKSSKNTTMGCGMGISNIYIIENCYFNQDYINISYHNSVSANAGANRLYISSCYGKGIVRIIPIGTSTVKTQCFVSNCRFETITKDAPASDVDNIELIKWNNIETLNS